MQVQGVNTNNTGSGNAGSVVKSLLHIWFRLMTVDPSCKADLLKDSAFLYFSQNFAIDPVGACKTLVTFGLDNPTGRDALLAEESFLELLENNIKNTNKGIRWWNPLEIIVTCNI